ncbi:MAG: prepilin peptidase, partial [Rhodoferax sp.]
MWFDPWLDAALGGILGLLVGSFLNVVIYRFPKMLERQWAAECAEYAATIPTGSAITTLAAAPEVFNLWAPRSRCPNCGHQVRWYENIPVVSYLFLRGKCSACSTP